MTLLDLRLFVMEYQDGISPEKVTELFERDYPPGLAKDQVAQIMSRFCRQGKNCQMDELEDLFKELQRQQPSLTLPPGWRERELND